MINMLRVAYDEDQAPPEAESRENAPTAFADAIEGIWKVDANGRLRFDILRQGALVDSLHLFPRLVVLAIARFIKSIPFTFLPLPGGTVAPIFEDFGP
jgi:hypothetical protein